jgi:sarcosine oxidase
MHYDAIVIGTGGVGSAALYHLSRAGAKAIGLDRFPPGHNQGSSHGQTRIIRQAYHEHPNYVPLLLRAYELWHELEQESQQKLFHQVGLLFGGNPDGEIISGVLRAAAEHNLPVEDLSLAEANARWPGYRLREDHRHVFEKLAGFLLVEDCVKAHADAAVRLGAKLQIGGAVRSWKVDGNSVVVETDDRQLSADKLVITAGAWATDLLASLGVPFRVLRKPLFWYRTKDSSYEVASGCPCFFFETLGGQFYGFPQTNELGVKIAEHTGGEPVSDPLHVDRSLHPADQQRIEACLAEHLPRVSRECTSHAVCMYTMSPDEHFVIGQHREYSQVGFAAGLSGHGFKFTSVLGEIMAQLTLDGKTPLPIGFLSPNRFA